MQLILQKLTDSLAVGIGQVVNVSRFYVINDEIRQHFFRTLTSKHVQAASHLQPTLDVFKMNVTLLGTDCGN